MPSTTTANTDKNTANAAKSEGFKDLTPLQQSAWILEGLKKGMTKKEIVAICGCGGDKQLVSVWIDLIMSMNWLERKKIQTVLTSDMYNNTETGKHALEE